MNTPNVNRQASPDAKAANAAVSVRAMSAEDIAHWDDFVLNCSEATFFHRSGWKTVIERAFGHKTWYLLAERAGKIEGILPLAEIKSLLFGHFLSSLPFCVYGGIAANSEEARHALDRAAQELAAQRQVGHLEYRNLRPFHSDWQGKDLYVTFRKEISDDDETNMLAIPRKQRAMVRKGIKAQLQSEIDEDIERFFTAYSTSVHHLGTPVFSKKYFSLLKQVFDEDCEILTIVKDGELIASVMSFYFRDEVLPYYGGGMPAARSLAGNDFMYWELMRRSAERGIRIFDFGRSKQGTGSFDFKKNWGFEPQALSYEYQLHGSKSVPDVNPLNPKYRLMIKLWQRMPIALANRIGPHIVKNLG